MDIFGQHRYGPLGDWTDKTALRASIRSGAPTEASWIQGFEAIYGDFEGEPVDERSEMVWRARNGPRTA